MFGDTEAIVIRQVKTLDGRRMLLLFTKEYGKISAGTSLNEKGRSRSSLALQPFCYGRYSLKKVRDLYFLNSGEVTESHYAIGQDLEKYGEACFALELTEKLLPEEAPAPALFRQLLEYLAALEQRGKDCRLLTLAYQIKAIAFSGAAPVLDSCVCCGRNEELTGISIEQGGAVCARCAESLNGAEPLISDGRFDIVTILSYLLTQPFSKLLRLRLDEQAAEKAGRVLDLWQSHYLDIGRLKSREMLVGAMSPDALFPQKEKEPE